MGVKVEAARHRYNEHWQRRTAMRAQQVSATLRARYCSTFWGRTRAKRVAELRIERAEMNRRQSSDT